MYIITYGNLVDSPDRTSDERPKWHGRMQHCEKWNKIEFFKNSKYVLAGYLISKRQKVSSIYRVFELKICHIKGICMFIGNGHLTFDTWIRIGHFGARDDLLELIYFVHFDVRHPVCVGYFHTFSHEWIFVGALFLIFKSYPEVQCAAVNTHLGLISDPPQNHVSFKLIPTNHGNSWAIASTPPTILFWLDNPQLPKG